MRIDERMKKVGAFSAAVACLGLLLWARFMIISGRPRTATAEPQEKVEYRLPLKKAAAPGR